MADSNHDQERHSSSRRRDRSRHRDSEKERSHRHHHHHRSHRHRSRSRDGDRDRRRSRSPGDREHRKKRSRRDGEDDEGRRHHHHQHHKSRRDEDEAPAETAAAPTSTAKRDEWMVEPSGDFIDYTQRGTRKASPQRTAVAPDYRPIIHKNELNQQLREGKPLDEHADDENGGAPSYTFGDHGSSWRMTKLKRCYEAANDSGVDIEVVALERYGDLRLFDDAREEEMELGRREMYGKDRRDAKEKPTGELWRERLKKRQEVEGKMAEREAAERQESIRMSDTAPSQPVTKVLDQTALNKMRAALMKAQLRGDPKAAKMEEEYNAAMEAARQGAKNEDNVVVLSAMDSRQLAGLEGRVGREVVLGKKGKVVENEDMTIEDMLREEKITRGQGAGRQMAERISRDAKFDVSSPPLQTHEPSLILLGQP
jgi:hypothetical protein